MIDARPNTNRLMELIDEGLLDMETVLLAALNWLSEDDVLEMAERNDLMSAEEEQSMSSLPQIILDYFG